MQTISEVLVSSQEVFGTSTGANRTRPQIARIRDLRGITAAGERKNAIGCVVWKQPHKPDDDAVVILRLKDWQELHGPHKKKTPDRYQVGRSKKRST